MKVASVEGSVGLSAVILLLLVATDAEICFKRYNLSKRGCHREERNQVTSPEECCKSGGQGYSKESKRKKTGQRRKWFVCTPCSPEVETAHDVQNEVTKSRHLKGKAVVLSKSSDKDKIRQWTEWSDWGPCSVTCGLGSEHRGRFCVGEECSGDDLQVRPCSNNTPPCPVDGGWDEWGQWQACSATCGEGVEVRTRGCHSPAPQHGGALCEGVIEQSRHCNEAPCPVDGDWSPWTEWGHCNVTCGQGYMGRERQCDRPSPQYGGRPCEGDYRQMTTCHTQHECPVDGGWCDWGDWTPCLSAGTQMAFRVCECPQPRFDGLMCTGRSETERRCEEDAFDVTLADDEGSTEASGGAGCGGAGSGDGSDINCDQEPDDVQDDGSGVTDRELHTPRPL